MNKRSFSFGLIIVFTVILFYFLSTKTSLQLFVKTTKADGQTSSYGVDIIKFNTPISVTSKTGGPAINIKDIANNQCNIGVESRGMKIDKPLSINDTNFWLDYGEKTINGNTATSLWATKDNGSNWTDVLAGGGGNVRIEVPGLTMNGANYSKPFTTKAMGLFYSTNFVSTGGNRGFTVVTNLYWSPVGLSSGSGIMIVGY